MTSSLFGSMLSMSSCGTRSSTENGAKPARPAASRYVYSDIPRNATRRPAASAARFTLPRRWMLEANCVAITRPLPSCSATFRSRFSATSRSPTVRPGDSTFVESDISSATPSAPAAAKASRSNAWPSSGSSSIFQSPVCTMLPNSLRRIMPQQSGMECVTRNGSILQCGARLWRPCAAVAAMLCGAVRGSRACVCVGAGRVCCAPCVKRNGYTVAQHECVCDREAIREGVRPGNAGNATAAPGQRWSGCVAALMFNTMPSQQRRAVARESGCRLTP